MLRDLSSKRYYNLSRIQKEGIIEYYTSVGVTVAALAVAKFCCFGLLRPHLTVIRSPSTSTPLAHACAAISATARSLKLTKAHLGHRQDQTIG